MINLKSLITEGKATTALMRVLLILIGLQIIYVLTMNSRLTQLIFENTVVSIILFIVFTLILVSFKKREKITIKTSIFIISYFVFFLPVFLYFQSFNFISLAKTSIFYEYATKGEYKADPIFTKENLDENKLSETIENIFKTTNNNMNNVKKKQGVYSVLSINNEITYKELEGNSDFQNYLSKIHWKTSDVIDYIKRLESFDTIILKTSYYISFLLMFVYCLLKINIRSELYAFAGLVYIISTLGLISNDFTSVIIFQKNSYSELSEINGILNVIKESLLTFIIFDTLIQIINDKKKLSAINTNVQTAQLNNVVPTINTISKDLKSKSNKKKRKKQTFKL